MARKAALEAFLVTSLPFLAAYFGVFEQFMLVVIFFIIFITLFCAFFDSYAEAEKRKKEREELENFYRNRGLEEEQIRRIVERNMEGNKE
jgi:Flp pilus assembly protein TadB